MTTTLVKDKRFELTKKTDKAFKYFQEKHAFEMSAYELNSHLCNKNVQVIDVRSRESFVEFRIEGAINIPLSQLKERLNELDREKINVVYCSSLYCRASNKAAMILAENGYNVMELIGGIEAWREHSFPIERCQNC